MTTMDWYKVSVLHASSLSQVITYQLLEQWGSQGFFQHIEKAGTDHLPICPNFTFQSL